MRTCELNGTRFLVPDKYLEKLQAKLGPTIRFSPLADLSLLRNAPVVDILVDDPRFTDRFVAKSLDFVREDRRFPLLSERIDPDRISDHSFSSLSQGKNLDYRVVNLAEGASDHRDPKGFRVVLCGLGDVGGTLLTGLRLLGDETISEILIYDRSESKLQRWYREASQILKPDGSYMPPLRIIGKDELFQGDVFIFCVSAGVPPVGQESGKDVRMIQLEKNAAILQEYVDLAASAAYEGYFYIVSDPVDQLCMSAWRRGGLQSRQIRGFGLGVMYARAVFHARENSLPVEDLRVYGPHGQGLQVLNSSQSYDQDLSLELTEKTRTENLTIRAAGFKPYIAPALSSGALSILACLKGQWHYSSTLLDGVWFGTRNRRVDQYVEYESLPLAEDFTGRLEQTRRALIASMETSS